MKIGLTFTVRSSQSVHSGQAARSGPAIALDSSEFEEDVSAFAESRETFLADPCSDRTDSSNDDEEEFDSPETILALAAAVESLGHEVELLGDGEPMIARLLAGPKPDLVLNIAEGRGISRSREARVPAILETLGIPYTGSDPLTLAATLDKDCAKRLVAASGVPTPAWVLVEGNLAEVATQLDGLALPAIVKPAFEGSSKGILGTSVVETREALHSTLEQQFDVYRQPILVEEFIDGDELTVGLVGNAPPRILGVMRVLPRQVTERFVYSLEVKRDFERMVRYECPAQLSEEEYSAVEDAARQAWRALGCRDVSRIDFRLRDGVPYFLETNPLPGLSPSSGDLVLLSGLIGLSHRELIGLILQAACERWRLPVGYATLVSA
jgi:D-alanine-D-alanine ligase